MKLADYLAAEGRTIQALSHATGLRWATISDIASGKSVPTAATAKRIEAATEGEVTAAELLGLAEPESVPPSGSTGTEG